MIHKENILINCTSVFPNETYDWKSNKEIKKYKKFIMHAYFIQSHCRASQQIDLNSWWQGGFFARAGIFRA